MQSSGLTHTLKYQSKNHNYSPVFVVVGRLVLLMLVAYLSRKIVISKAFILKRGNLTMFDTAVWNVAGVILRFGATICFKTSHSFAWSIEYT